MLNFVATGDRQGRPPVLIVHGLYGSARNWGAIARRLSDRRQVIAVDMRNHGHSLWADSQTYPDMADDLADVIGAQGGLADVVGHSMGGKAAMALALLHPGTVDRLVVADIAPVAYAHSHAHYIDAMRGVDLSLVDRRSDADAALAAAVPEAGVRAFLLQSLDIRQRHWRLNLDVLEAFMPDLVGWPDIQAVSDRPTLFLSGGDSNYVTADSRAATRRLFPKARFARISGVGHWLHAEKPREFTDSVRAFLDAGRQHAPIAPTSM